MNRRYIYKEIICLRMLTYADVCWRMLTYADVWWRMLTLHHIIWCAEGWSAEDLESLDQDCHSKYEPHSFFLHMSLPASGDSIVCRVLSFDQARRQARLHTSAYVSIRQHTSAHIVCKVLSSDQARRQGHTCRYISNIYMEYVCNMYTKV